MPRPKSEMSEKNLIEMVKIFLPKSNWVAQKRFYYDETNRKKYYQVDCFSEKLGIVWEYEGPNHYNDVWKLKRDIERQNYFVNKGYIFHRWPYWLQLTKDIAKHFFRKSTLINIK